MFSRNKILIGAAIIVLAAAMGYVFYARTKVGQQPNNIPVTQEPGTTTGTGGLTQVSPSPVYDGRGNLIIKIDPTQPFVSITPRGEEAQNTQLAQNTPGIDFQNFNQAVSDGLIPDKNGLYTQTVSPSGFSVYDQKAYDYSLPETQFISKYYGTGTVANVINGTTPADLQDNITDPLVVASSPGTPSTVPVVNGVDASMFRQSTNNASAYQVYIKQLSDATKPFDLVHDSNTIQKVFNAQSAQELNSYKAKAQQVLAAIKNVAVPPSLLGLSEAYYRAYQNYIAMIDAMAVLNAAYAAGADATDANIAFGAAYNALSDSLAQIQTNISIAVNIVRG
jgi:hypothetical protein